MASATEDEIVSMLSVDCHVGVQYTTSTGLIIDILEPALKLMLSRAVKGGVPSVGSVVTLYMVVTPKDPEASCIITPGVHTA